MSNGKTLEGELADALEKACPSSHPGTNYLEVVDRLILALAGRAVFVSKEEYDELVRAARMVKTAGLVGTLKPVDCKRSNQDCGMGLVYCEPGLKPCGRL